MLDLAASLESHDPSRLCRDELPSIFSPQIETSHPQVSADLLSVPYNPRRIARGHQGGLPVQAYIAFEWPQRREVKLAGSEFAELNGLRPNLAFGGNQPVVVGVDSIQRPHIAIRARLNSTVVGGENRCLCGRPVGWASAGRPALNATSRASATKDPVIGSPTNAQSPYSTGRTRPLSSRHRRRDRPLVGQTGDSGQGSPTG